jgi:predicted alpha/beta hydrolase family esterase
MTRHVLFLQGGGEGAYDADARLAASLGAKLGPEYEIRYPMMPDEDAPEYPTWKRRILEEVATLGGGAVLVGHSLGASILLKAIADGESMPAAKAVFLIAAPYWGGKGWIGWEDVELSEDELARLSATEQTFFYHGTDDAVVPDAHLDLYGKALPHAKLQRLAGRDHQLNDDLSEVAADIRSLTEGGGG